MKTKASKLFTIVTTIILLLSISNIVAYAYRVNSFALPFSDQYYIEIKPTWNNSYSYSLDCDAATSAWNRSNAPIYLTRTNTVLNDQYVDMSSDFYGNIGWDGLAWPLLITSPKVATIQINETSTMDTGSDAYYNKAELIAHELGHVLGLLDVGWDDRPLMRATGYKGSPDPTADDVSGVQVRYNN